VVASFFFKETQENQWLNVVEKTIEIQEASRV